MGWIHLLQVFVASHVAGANGVYLPVTNYRPEGAASGELKTQLTTGASRVVISMTDVIQTAVDFLNTGVATGESTIERLSRYAFSVRQDQFVHFRQK